MFTNPRLFKCCRLSGLDGFHATQNICCLILWTEGLKPKLESPWWTNSIVIFIIDYRTLLVKVVSVSMQHISCPHHLLLLYLHTHKQTTQYFLCFESLIFQRKEGNNEGPVWVQHALSLQMSFLSSMRSIAWCSD